ncbi:unnamed protein product [Prorocentrum cordatum]|uniref:Uncharacterized protein n=1 Tax=Prorocentrum cordatum TaxID=2364126 RepID=A0ABN9VGJ7_9DINO|nr:unnamed protein product [Polarella glacialis]
MPIKEIHAELPQAPRLMPFGFLEVGATRSRRMRKRKRMVIVWFDADCQTPPKWGHERTGVRALCYPSAARARRSHCDSECLDAGCSGWGQRRRQRKIPWDVEAEEKTRGPSGEDRSRG